MSDAAVVGPFTLGGMLLSGLVTYGLRWLDRGAEAERRQHERDAAREDRRAAEMAELRREGGTAFASSEQVAGGCEPDRGYKQSGMGREMGMHAVNLYTEVKNIYFSSE